MKKQSKICLVFMVSLFFIIQLSRTQSISNSEDNLLRSDSYYPLFDVQIGYYEPPQTWNFARWVFNPEMKVTGKVNYNDKTSEIEVKPDIEENITIDFSFHIPGIYGLHCSLPALGTYENIAIRDEYENIIRNETSLDETSLFVDFQGEMSCDAIATGNATGSGKLHWNNATWESFVIQHQENAKPDFYFHVELSNFTYEVSLHASYRYISDTESDLDVIFHNNNVIIVDTASTDYTYTVYYIPGFQMIIPIVILTLFSIGYLVKRKK